MIKPRIAWPLAGLMLACSSVYAVTTDGVSQLSDFNTDKLLSSSVKPIDVNSFGENVGYQFGGVSFYQDDIVLNGIGPEIRIGRRFSHTASAQSGYETLDNSGANNAADWKVEIPRIHVKVPLESSMSWLDKPSTLALRGSWKVLGSNPVARCSNIQGIPDLVINSDSAGYRETIPAKRWWSGVFMSLPGSGSNELLRRSTQNTKVPTSTIAGTTGGYNIVTKDDWRITCLTSLKNGEQGEGFLSNLPRRDEVLV